MGRWLAEGSRSRLGASTSPLGIAVRQPGQQSACRIATITKMLTTVPISSRLSVWCLAQLGAALITRQYGCSKDYSV